MGDNFDEHDPLANPIRGVGMRFKDGAYVEFAEPINTTSSTFTVLDRGEAWVKLEKDCVPEYKVREPGKPRPPQPHVDKKDWVLDLNKQPAHPWKLTFFLYLLNAITGELSTFWTNTIGGKIALAALSDQISFMRRVRPDAVPIIKLESKSMPTKFGGPKPRPHFNIVRWASRGAAGSQTLLAGPEQKDAGLQKLEPPTTAEHMNDSIPF
jgi:hypothetical protein